MSHAAKRLAALLALFAALACVIVVACPPPALAGEQGGAVSKVTDPDTSSSWTSVFGTGEGTLSYSTGLAGRIWVDKSVFGSTAEAQAAGLPVTLENEEHGFAIGLSALSSAASVREESDRAHDVVFVVSLNRSLSDMTYAGRERAYYLADALNAAIGRLMAENDGTGAETRVSVIGYSSSAVTLMPLDAYEPNDSGDYVSFSPKEGGAPGTLQVVGTPKGGSKTQGARLGGGAYLQQAVYLAGQELVEGAKDPDASQRDPALVVMGLDVAPMASTDFENPTMYTGTNDDSFLGPTPGGSHLSGFGTDAAFATLLTMRSVEQNVNDAWKASDSELSVYATGVDTTGMGTFLLQTAHGQEVAQVSGSGEASGTNLADNVHDAAEAYGTAAAKGESDVTLSLYGSGDYDLVSNPVSFPVANGLLSPSDGYALSVVDEYLPAHSIAALSWTFGNAVDRMLGIEYDAPASGGQGEDLPGGSRVTVSDEVGAGMRVARVDGIVYGSELLDGALAAQAVEISFTDPYDPEATHEFAYLVAAMNDRYNLGNSTYDLFFEALMDGQFSYQSDTSFSNRASWYVNADHGMVPTGGSPYTFASQAEVNAITDGSWQQDADAATRAKIETAQAAGATAVCETYFYIGNLANQYSGGDVTLYDFVVMVETNLDTGRQTVLLSAPVDAIPARLANVVLHQNGTATMSIENAEDTSPVRLAYQVEPTSAVEALLDRADAGGEVTYDELVAAAGGDVTQAGSDGWRLYASGFTGSGASAEAGTIASAWAAQTNSYYGFVRNTPLLTLKSGETVPEGQTPTSGQLEPLTTLPEPGQTYYYEKTVYSATLPSPDDTVTATKETYYLPYLVTLGSDEIAQHFSLAGGQCLALAGTPKYRVPALLASAEKDPNATLSAPYVTLLTVEQPSTGGTHLSARLGNNGALVLEPTTPTGSLRVTKTVEGNAGDLSQAFPIEVTLSRSDGTPVAGTLNYELETGADDPSPTSGVATVHEDGSVTLEDGRPPELASGQSITLVNVPVGTSYSVEETNAYGHTLTTSRTVGVGGVTSPAEGTAGTIGTEGQEDVVSLTNTKVVYGTLVVEKNLVGVDDDREFSFTVTLTGDDGEPLSGEVSYSVDSGADQTATLTDGSFTVGLKGGQRLTLDSLPQGVGYLVSEQDYSSEGYLTLRSGETGTIGDTPQTASFTNVSAAGDLGIAKFVAGNAAEQGREFRFEVTVKGLFTGQGSDVTSLEKQATRYEGASGTPETVTFTRTEGTNEGVATVSGLSSGQGMLISELPEGASYTVSELDADELAGEGYHVYSGSAEEIAQGHEDASCTGTLPAGSATAAAYFLNVRDLRGTLRIESDVAGQAALDEAAAGRPFSYEVESTTATGSPVTGSYTCSVSGEPATVEFVNSRATLLVPAGGWVEIEGLPAGGTTTVTQVDASGEGYVTTPGLSQDASVPSGGTATVTFLNEKSYSPTEWTLTATSTLTGRDQGAGEFTFSLLNADGSPVVVDGRDVQASSSASAAGVAAPLDFPALSLDAPGTYTYLVRQDIPADGSGEEGVTYDQRTFSVTVSVTADALGRLTVDAVDVTLEGEPAQVAFVNAYATGGGTDPEGPTDPEEPTDPEGPTDPEEPSGPESPTTPEQPTDPDQGANEGGQGAGTPDAGDATVQPYGLLAVGGALVVVAVVVALVRRGKH